MNMIGSKDTPTWILVRHSVNITLHLNRHHGTQYFPCLNSVYKWILNSFHILPQGEKFPLIWLHCSSLMHLIALPQLCFSKWVLTASAWRLQHLSMAIPQARLWISQGAQKENNNIIRELHHHIVHTVIRNLFLSASLWDTYNLRTHFSRGAKEQNRECKLLHCIRKWLLEICLLS